MPNIRGGNFEMSKLTTIKSEADHAAVLEEIEKLIGADPAPNTPEADRLNLLGLIASDYEARVFPTQVPDAVDAIRFRMEQQDLAPRDLIPYIGSRSKVSEVLNRKRSLTLPMVRALHERLHIPAKALIHQAELLEPEEPDWSRFPIRDMAARGWITGSLTSLQRFFAQLPQTLEAEVLCRRTVHIRSARKMDLYALKAWTAQVIIEAKKSKPPPFKRRSVTSEFMRKVAQLSVVAEGPTAARNFLFDHGIPLIVEPHLPHTYLDGAAILLIKDRPIIGMTVRHDRLDNFWFTLLHELAHVALHFDSREGQFIDDLDVGPKNDRKEQEADKLAGETLIPSEAWKRSPASRLRSPEAAMHLAQELRIHPAIVAGRMRHHWKAFRMLNHLVGHRAVMRQFREEKWPD
jgi:HTH-type transcriptional regulator/antitoxin HigA